MPMLTFKKNIAGTESVFVNPQTVTHVSQIGQGDRATVHFVGGGEVEIPMKAQAIVAQLNPHMR